MIIEQNKVSIKPLKITSPEMVGFFYVYENLVTLLFMWIFDWRIVTMWVGYANQFSFPDGQGSTGGDFF